jgi:hypothetical protein
MSKQNTKGNQGELAQVDARESRDIIRTWLTILAVIQTIFLAGVIGTGLLTLPTLLNVYKESDRITQIGNSMQHLRDSTEQMVHRIEITSAAIEASKGTLEKKVKQFEGDIGGLRASVNKQKTEMDSVMSKLREYEFFMVPKK